jgi:hypothetical protein
MYVSRFKDQDSGMRKPKRALAHDTPAIYRIQLQGELDESLKEYLDMSITVVQGDDGLKETILYGWLADQAALLGVLNNMYDIGFSLLSVVSLDVYLPKGDDPRE